MRRTTDRLNRAVLALIGLVLVGLGASCLVRGAGPQGDRRVISAWLRDWAQSRQVQLLVGLGVIALLLLWLGLAWLLAQLPKHRPVARVELDPTEHATHLEVSARALAEAVAADVRRVSGVTGASARVVNEQPLAVDLDVALEDGADLNAVNRAIADRPRRNLLEALELAEVDLRVKLHLARPPARRVA